MHWIQAKKSHEDAQPIIKVKVTAVHDDGRAEIVSRVAKPLRSDVEDALYSTDREVRHCGMRWPGNFQAGLAG
jgi:hypothetical protein